MDANLENEKIHERRAGPDSLIKLTLSIAKLSWVIAFFVIIFSWVLISSIYIIEHVSRTPIDDFIGQHNNFVMPADWDSILIGYSFYLSIFMFVICTLGLLFNSFRHHRKSDTYNKSLLVFSILSFAWIIVHLFYFKAW